MELSLPAGNLQCAIVAYENGADSVYFGLKHFSARKGAENFSFDDVRRLKLYATNHNKKFYIALNTLVNDDELDDIRALLREINYLSPDGIIVEDWGVINEAKRICPNVELHASTQMAANSTSDVMMLKKLGFTRVVLGRELSLTEIEAIRKACPDVELKVFIHGALCYSISGQCYASKMITKDRSANRGDCAQVCRWLFENEDGAKGHFFSLSDLECTKNEINALKRIGVDAVKVEGRLKNSLYVKHATRYYRAILDGKSDDVINDARRDLETSFSRKTSCGYFMKETNLDIECSDYVGHRGTPIGTFIDNRSVKLSEDVHIHDGLLFIDNNNNVQKFAIPERYRNAKKGDVIKIDIKGTNGAGSGAKLYRIKSGSENEKSFNPLSYDLYLKKVDVTITITPSSIKANATDIKPENDTVEVPFKAEMSHSKQDNLTNFRKAFNTKEGLFTIGKLTIINKCIGITDINDIFIPMSLIKELKKQYYAKLNEEQNEYFTHDNENNSDTLPNDDVSKNESEDYFKITSIGEIKNAHNHNKILISSTLDITNQKAKEYFIRLFKGKTVRFEDANENALLKSTPIFTSKANIPDDGTYKTRVGDKTITFKVITKNDNKITYVI